VLLAVLGTGCQQPAQPGPMERTGAQIDQTMGRAQQGVGDFGQRVGRALGQAGQSAGDAASAAGTSVHDWLVPSGTSDQPPGVDPSQAGTTNRE
jgi:hypothetical protein